MIKLFTNLPFVLLYLITFSTSAQSNQAANTFTTANGTWTFTIFSGNIIKATYTATGSNRNEQVSDAVIAKAIAIENRPRKTGSTLVKWNEKLFVQAKDSGLLFNDDNI